jgi:hypothetical protein
VVSGIVNFQNSAQDIRELRALHQRNVNGVTVRSLVDEIRRLVASRMPALDPLQTLGPLRLVGWGPEEI